MYTQNRQTGWEEESDAKAGMAAPPVARPVQLAAGGVAVLYALDTGGAPAAGADEITSVSGALVLNSAAVQLGEYGTVRELTESELYRWADAGKFDSIAYTQPLPVGEGRYTIHLRLQNARVGMEQMVVFTDLGGGVARVDRLWRTIADVRSDAGLPAFDRAAQYLLSEQTR